MHFQKIIFNAIKYTFVFMLITAWLFSPWAQLTFEFGNKKITLGPKTQEAHAATCGTNGTYNASDNGRESCTYTTAGADTFTPPTGVTSIHVAAWGSGGGGFDGSSSGGGKGGGGGAFASTTITVVAGTPYNLTVGDGGTEGTAGTDSLFNTDDIIADGGAGGTSATTGGGTGGSLANTSCDGANCTVEYAGGNGGNGYNGGTSDDNGGGGGGSAGPHGGGGNGAAGVTGQGQGGGGGNGGNSATDINGGSSTNGGAGGNGNASIDGSPGTSHANGGGGGGGADNGDGGGNGGAPGGGGGAGTVCDDGTQCQGANGKIYITWETPAVAPTISISGTLYSDEGTTAITSGKTIKMYIATTSPAVATTTTSSGSGTFTFAGIEGIGLGTPISLWVAGEAATRAFTLTKASSTSDNITGADIYQDRIIAKHEGFTGTSTTIGDFAWYDADDDSDIQFIANGGTLEVKKLKMLYIAPGSEFAPGGAVTLHGNASTQTDGDLKLAYGNRQDGVATTSIFSPDGNALSLAGSWYASSSDAILNSSGTVTFTATTTGKSVYASSTPFYNLSFDGVDGTAGGWTFQENASTTGALTLTDGTVVAPSWLSIAGNFTNNGTFTAGTGTTTFNGTGAQTLLGTMTGSSAFNNVEFNNSFSGGASWYNSDWLYRKKITLKQASTTLSAFPALVSLSDTDLAARAQADGDDIVFTDSDGTTKLSHEIENYASGGGVNAWVKIPTLSSAAVNDIYMYYGNAATSSEETPTTVWDGSYEAVWHMSEDPTGVAPQILDSTVNNNDGTVAGTWVADDQTLASSTASAKIGGALNFAGLTTSDYINGGSGSSVDLVNTLTATVWVNGGDQSQDTFSALFAKMQTGTAGWEFDASTAGPIVRFRLDTSGASNQTGNIGTALDSVWHRLALNLDNGTVKAYLDDDQTINTTYTHGSGFSTTNPVNIGRQQANVNYFAGLLDEARIASTTLSADWLAIEYDNINATTSFYSAISSEETDSGSGIGVTLSNSASTTNMMILQGGLKVPSYLYISGNFDNAGTFNANSGTTTFNGTSQQYISGFATGTNAFAGLEFLNATASTTFTAAASSTGLMSAVAGARIELFAGATTTAQNISIAGASGNEVYLHSTTPATLWNFEVPGDRSVSYANIKDSNACYTSGNNITASNSTDGGNNTCWSISAPASPGTLTLSVHDAGQESDNFNTSDINNVELFLFKLTPATESITTTLIFKINIFGGIAQSDITDVQLFPDYDASGSIDTDDSEDPLGGSGTVSLTGNSGTITFSSFSTSTSMNYILRADVANITQGSSLLINLIVGSITATGVTSGQSIAPSGTVSFVEHDRIEEKAVGSGSATGEVLGAQAEQAGSSEGNKGSEKTEDNAPSVSDETSGSESEGGGGRSELPKVFMHFASAPRSLFDRFINVFNNVL